MSVDQVGADVGTETAATPAVSTAPVSVDQVGADVGTTTPPGGIVKFFLCPSIRLVPTSAPSSRREGPVCREVSVDQVGADVGT